MVMQVLLPGSVCSACLESYSIFPNKRVMSVFPDLHLHYAQACRDLSQPENPFVARVLQEADKNGEISTKGMTLKLAGNNHLAPVPRVTDDDIAALVPVLYQAAFVTGKVFPCGNSSLRYLNLMFNDIGTSGAELIAEALHSNQSLVHLRMTGNKIGNQGGMFFASMLRINSTLEKLDLGDCDLGLHCLISTSIALTQNKSLKAINLNRPLLSSQQEETTVHVAWMLRINSSLVELHLGKHGMKNFGVERLCEALYGNSSLRYLDLSCNSITYDGVKSLGELLKRNKTLRILDLSANRIEDNGAIYLSEALATRNMTLHGLSVVSNNITDEGLVALAHAMQANTTLTHIYIWGNKIGTNASVAFWELIEMGRLEQGCTDVVPYEVDGEVFLAELSHGLDKHRYWAPRSATVEAGAANASLGILPVSEFL
ncbi:hypothetical protein HGM15179_009736 [Zosterops borbonicus]|uniref:Leucine rich repeat containing 34 n=1 Tax=Zosterops borbonicus TaxID=364589 RepID=A0A8K1GFW4_9PASS|nr:hypothetical protein HGM15179_009736 [Zosterops borbonicus]